MAFSPGSLREGMDSMAKLPDVLAAAWEERDGPVVLTTVGEGGKPNSIYASCVSRFGDDMIVVADNFFDKTRANILAGSTGSILFITKSGKSLQVKGPLERHTGGEVFDDMKSWNGERPGHAAVTLRVEEAFSGAKRLL